MKEQNEEKQNLELSDVISSSEAFIEKNQNVIIGVLIAIVVVVLAFFGLKKWYFEPRNEAAAEEMFAAQNYFDEQNYEQALNGDDQYAGFLDIIDNYGGTKSGKLARYYAGVCELRLGMYDEAVEHFKDYTGKDTYTESLSLMQRGDAEVMNDNVEEAIKLYEKAANSNPDFIVAPTALFKAGLGYITLGDGAKAVECFQQVKDNYPESTEANEMDKYIGYAENM